MSAPERIQIAYVSSTDPLDKRTWSGANFSIHQSLSQWVGDVHILGPFLPKGPLSRGRLLNGLAQKILGKRVDYRHSKPVSRAFAEYFGNKLKEKKYDLVIAPAASSEIAYLETNIPIVYISDTTFKASLNYHKALTNLLKSSERESFQVEKLALEKSSVIGLPSRWAIQSAVSDFNIDPGKIALLPFGANFEKTPDASFAEKKEIKDTCKLLFIGVNWENKGGPIAYEAFRFLHEKGIHAELTVCGCTPPEQFRHEKLKVIPFLNKNIPEQRLELQGLFEQANFFILPTRFEAFGLVFSEAAAYGLISLATDTGGVSGAVIEGVSGFLFSKNDTGRAYAEKIISIWNNPLLYKELVRSSRKLFEEKLNWDSWGKSLAEKIVSTIPAIAGKLPQIP